MSETQVPVDLKTVYALIWDRWPLPRRDASGG